MKYIIVSMLFIKERVRVIVIMLNKILDSIICVQLTLLIIITKLRVVLTILNNIILETRTYEYIYIYWIIEFQIAILSNLLIPLLRTINCNKQLTF